MCRLSFILFLTSTSVFEKATAATGCWRQRLSEVAHLRNSDDVAFVLALCSHDALSLLLCNQVIGKNLTDVTISNARTLADVTSLLKSLYKAHKRTRTSARFASKP